MPRRTKKPFELHLSTAEKRLLLPSKKAELQRLVEELDPGWPDFTKRNIRAIQKLLRRIEELVLLN